MSFSLFNKILVIGILVMFLGIAVAPCINVISKEFDTIETVQAQEETSVKFYVFDKTGKSESEMVLSLDDLNRFKSKFEELNHMITYNPSSDETQDLKVEFIDFLDNIGLIPESSSRDDVIKLINPNFNSRRPLFSSLPQGVSGNRGSAFFCNFATFGEGSQFPVIILPRLIPILLTPIPRVIMRWNAISGYTSCGGLLSGKGFIAEGAHQGMALGFWGIGFSVFLPPVMGFGFVGYALFATATADVIHPWPPNRPPVISQENPLDDSVNVPVGLSELSFHISDADGDRMNYTVTTSPNIGYGSGNSVDDGTYSVDVSGLNSNAEYSWSVFVSDGEDTSEETFSFRTAIEPPFISDPLPVDGDSWVSVDLSELSFNLKDFQDDLMDYTVETAPDIGSSSGSGVGNGVYSVDISYLDYTKEYSWFVNVTDGKYWTRRIFSFKTRPILVFDPYDEGWQYRKKITINHSQVAGDLMDFPVLVSLVDSDLADKAQIDGDDILFMDDDDVANRLLHEIEKYDDSTGELVAWVNISNLSSSVDTVLYLYYGNLGCGSQQYPFRVWNSDFIAIYHMNGSKYTDVDDSTFNNLDVIEQQGNPVFQQPGKIGYCVDFDEDSLNVDDNDLLSFTFGSHQDKPFTIETWVKHDSVGGDNNGIISKYANMKREWLLRKTGDDKCDLYLCDDSTEASIWRKSSSNINVNNKGWNYISASYGRFKNGNDIVITLDGAINNGETWTGPSYNGMENLNEKMRIGAHHSPNNGWHYWQGLIDEVRISSIVRTPEWLQTSYNTMNDPFNFLIIGPEESGP